MSLTLIIFYIRGIFGDVPRLYFNEGDVGVTLPCKIDRAFSKAGIIKLIYRNTFSTVKIHEIAKDS